MDKESFEELYKTHYKKLFMVAFGYVQSTPLAEEIVHEVFLNVWKKREEIQFRSNQGAYLYKSIVNTSLNFLKKEKQTRNLEQNYFENNPHLQSFEDLEKWERMIRNLEKALETLPPQCKKVIMLSKIKGMKQKEIAEYLDISIKTVKNHTSYGYEKLREILKKDNLLILFLLLSSNTVHNDYES
jgi:RNA polymerase sigma-70 factor (ECF subfamily)